MIDATTQAAALEKLLQSKAEPLAQPLAEAILRCCDGLLSAGEQDLALALLEKARGMELLASPDWPLRLEVQRARALRVTGRFEEALELARRLLSSEAGLLEIHREVRCELQIAEAASLIQLNRHNEAIERLLVLRSELLRFPDSALLARCALQLSTAETFRGEYASARRYALEAIVSARRTADSHSEALGLDNLGRLERAACRWSSAEESSAAALEVFAAAGNRFYANASRRCLGIIAWKRGRIDSALGHAQEAVRDATALGSGMLQWYATLLEGMIYLHCGNYDKAVDRFTADAGWQVPRSHSRASLLTTEFLGDVDLEQGQAEEALKHYDEVWPKALALVPKGDIVAELRRRRAECYLLMGHLQEAYEEAKTGLEHCRELGDRYEEAATYRVLAMSAAAVGKPAEAKRWFEQGFAYYDDIETPYEWGKLWLAYGDWLCGPLAAEFADRKGGLEAFEAARDHFERMGAQAKLAEAQARIANHAPPRTTPMAADAPAGPASRRPLRRPREQREMDARSKWAFETFGMVTQNRQMITILDAVQRLARSSSTVLVLGESGTGKELIAKAIHRISGRKGSFMPINCAALPREIIESELFGHTAGSFTGATRDKTGLFEVCDGGTVFLDEVAEMPQELQSRLLRFLETGEVRRVGSNRHISVNTRLVAATNRERAPLEKGEGFRTDLYYRLAHAVITLPPVRRRADDIEMLIEHFLAESNREEAKHVELTQAAFDRLLTYSWPGNVRQMRAVIRRVVILAHEGHPVAPDQLDLHDDSQVATTLLEELEIAERRRVEEALHNARGSRTEAAKMLGMPRTTLLNKIRRYGLTK